MFSKKNIAILLAEFMGVVVLACSAFSVIRWQLPSMFVAIMAGLVLGLLVNTIGSTSGAHVNPAITLGLWSVRKIQTSRAILYVGVQLLGGLATLALLKYLLGTELQSSIKGSFDWKVLISEGLGAFVFGFGVASAVYQKYTGNQLAFTVGLSLTAGILVASFASNAVVNPAVAIGLKSWSWAYAAGPVLGSILGMNVYALFFTEGEFNIPKKISIAKKSTSVAKKSVSSKAKSAKKRPAARKRR